MYENFCKDSEKQWKIKAKKKIIHPPPEKDYKTLNIRVIPIPSD